uniref:Uncharacterized protein n=1 Tax=Anguilla anguilla TaxID=7936 RepID=A0A0E9VU52_ANGAN
MRWIMGLGSHCLRFYMENVIGLLLK